MSVDLTDRQREIVRLVSLGCTVPEIAKILRLAPSTVDNHRTRAMAILGVDNKALLTRAALKYRVSTMKDKLTAAEKRKSGRRNDGWN